MGIVVRVSMTGVGARMSQTDPKVLKTGTGRAWVWRTGSRSC